ncbi:nuclear transport factor 2 family protein [Solimonas sp. K1W22B-7]|uniref:nuclear transport factor 2 family protein n=1 Tax=Solimonas sp. K1W22B-7 TaxID=2303331 RepID=UPI001968B5B0|nr:nuclear transport factor 2 family protein [Solimonas sp. K1W22B-7]
MMYPAKQMSKAVPATLPALHSRTVQAWIRSMFLALLLMAAFSPSISSASTAEELTDIEQIQQLKARYFRLMDTKQWQQWGEVFTEDATVQATSLIITINWQGRSQIVAQNSSFLLLAKTVHHGHMPEITLTSPTTATGIWAMEDRLEFPLVAYHGWGHYNETYQKVNGQWKIKSLVLTRLRERLGTVLTD